MWYAGLDVHKRYSYVTTMDEGGRIVGRVKIMNDAESLKGFFGSIPGPVKVAMEATCNWYYLYEILEGRGVEVKLAHPLKTRAIAEARIKTDKIDSTILAHLLRADLLPASYIPDRTTREVKELLRYRASLVRIETQIKNKVHSILLKNGISSPFADTFGKGGLRFLQGLELRQVYRQALEGYLRQLETLRASLKEVSKRIDRLARDNPAARQLATIPGIGCYSALLILSEIGDIARFPDAKHLCSYAGLVPSVYSSGGRIRLGRITKQGSRWLRWILVEAAMHAARSPGQLGLYYRRIAKRKGPKPARVALARKMLMVIYHMLKKGEPFKAGG